MTQTHGTDTSFYLIVPQDDAQLGNKIISTEAHSSTFSFEMKILLRNIFIRPWKFFALWFIQKKKKLTTNVLSNFFLLVPPLWLLFIQYITNTLKRRCLYNYYIGGTAIRTIWYFRKILCSHINILQFVHRVQTCRFIGRNLFFLSFHDSLNAYFQLGFKYCMQFFRFVNFILMKIIVPYPPYCHKTRTIFFFLETTINKKPKIRQTWFYFIVFLSIFFLCIKKTLF